MIKNSLIAHELGHALCAETQDGYWYATSLDFKGDDGAMANCYCDKHKNRKTNIKGKYTRIKDMMNLGGLYGELLLGGSWSPWSARCDIDDFTTSNQGSKAKIVIELDLWMWVDLDHRAFRSCTMYNDVRSRRAFKLDAHDTCHRLPHLWTAYMDFCDRIDKDLFKANVLDIAKANDKEVDNAELTKIMKEIIL